MPDAPAIEAQLDIADATAEHLWAIQAIYAHYVLHQTCTFEEVPPSVEEIAARHAAVRQRGLPFLVARIDGEVVGYAYVGGYRERAAYRHTVENSVYVAHGLHGRGIGKALLQALLDRCIGTDVRQVVAVIGDSANTGSIRLHASLGFEHVGTLREVGFKFGRWVDTVVMQRRIG